MFRSEGDQLLGDDFDEILDMKEADMFQNNEEYYTSYRSPRMVS